MAATRVSLTVAGVGADLRHLQVANPIDSGRSQTLPGTCRTRRPASGSSKAGCAA